jgi:P27 family predicted phage terminase small subunit
MKIPEDICKEAQDFLQGVIDVLTVQGVITSLDDGGLELFGYTYHTYIQATKTLLREGYTVTSERGYTKAHPCVKIQLDAQVQLTKLMDSFGLNPRSRKEIVKPKERDGKKTPIDKFLDKTREYR